MLLCVSYYSCNINYIINNNLQAQKIPVDAKEEIYEKMKMIVQTLFEGKFGPLPSYHLSLSIVQWISSHSSAINAKTITEVTF